MPELITAEPDKATAPPESDVEGAPPAEESDKEAFFKDFPSREVAEKAWDELHGAKTRVEQENADLRRRIELAESNQQILDRVVGLQEKMATGTSALTPEQEEARLEELSERTGVPVEGLRFMGGRIADIEDQYRKEIEARDKRLEELKDELTRGITTIREELNPEYLSNRERVDEAMTKYGVDRSTAIKIVKDQPATTEAGSAAPGGSLNGRVRPSQPAVGLSDDKRAEIEARTGPMTDQQWARLKAMDAEEQRQRGTV